ncbi:MAG TPA: hypothetical protein VKZ57_10205 [Sphingobacterium sp.]|nr:hypothetical protein [Sphingobacterium sp.]
MEKEEFRSMLLEAIDGAYHDEVEEWLKNAERGFERIAEATKWPIERIRGFYKLIGTEIRLVQEREGIEKPE